MCQVWDPNTFQRQQGPQTSVGQAQGPGPKGKEEWGHIWLPVWSHQLWRRMYRGNLQDPGRMLQRASQGALYYSCVQPIHWSSAQPRTIQHNRRMDQDLSRLIKESIYIRVNNPTLNRNIGKFKLSHVWNRVLFSTLDLKTAFS